MKKIVRTVIMVSLMICLFGSNVAFASEAKADTTEVTVEGFAVDVPDSFEYDGEGYMSESDYMYFMFGEGDKISASDLKQVKGREKEFYAEMQAELEDYFDEDELGGSYDKEIITLKFKNKKLLGQTMKCKSTQSGGMDLYLTWLLDMDTGNVAYAAGVFLAPTKATDKTYDDIIATARVYDGKSTKDKGSAKEVDTELKTLLDDYEEFVDEYCECVESYLDNPTNTKLLTRYAELTNELTEYTEALSEYDTRTMSAEDYAYFVEVTTRTSRKMLDVLD